jgi:hypothetical protein
MIDAYKEAHIDVAASEKQLADDRATLKSLIEAHRAKP